MAPASFFSSLSDTLSAYEPDRSEVVSLPDQRLQPPQPILPTHPTDVIAVDASELVKMP